MVMDLRRYDTPDWLSDALIDALPCNPPKYLLDLGAGGGSLTAAALRRWKETPSLTMDVDVDAHAEIEANFQFKDGIKEHRHVNFDVLEPDIDVAAGIDPGSVDIILSNPPYKSASWRPEFDKILDRAGLNRQAMMLNEVTLDLIFLAQALYLVRPGGHLGLIIPDTLVTGQKMDKVRAELSNAHAIERVIQLPRGAFSKTDAQAYILILTRGKPNKEIVLERVNELGSWSDNVFLPVSRAGERLDHAFHSFSECLEQQDLVPLSDFGIKVARGRHSSSQVKKSAGQFFHTTQFPSMVGHKVHLRGSRNFESKSRGVLAETGDILLARVDRSLEQKISIVASGSAIISDCVFRLRCNPQFRDRIFQGLCSSLGQSQLIARSRGVGARNLSIRELLKIVV